MALKHNKVSAKSDGGDSSLVLPSDWNDEHIADNQGLLITANTSSASAPASGYLKAFARNLANKFFLAFIGPAGIDMECQPHLGRNKVARWNPVGNSTAVPTADGIAALSTVGTSTARNVATTNYFTRLRRLGFVTTSTTAGLLVSIRGAAAQFTIGNGSGLGGFFYAIRFGCSDAATVSGARQFIGLSSSTSAPTNVEPSTLTNVLGVGHGASDTNLKIFYGGSAAQTAIDLGSNFPANTLSVDAYELILFASPNDGNVGYQVTRLNTGHIASGTLTGTAGTAIPGNTTFLNIWGFRTNNATALAVALDIISIYLETDS